MIIATQQCFYILCGENDARYLKELGQYDPSKKQDPTRMMILVDNPSDRNEANTTLLYKAIQASSTGFSGAVLNKENFHVGNKTAMLHDVGNVSIVYSSSRI
jgi:hypothetical protein